MVYNTVRLVVFCILICALSYNVGLLVRRLDGSGLPSVLSAADTGGVYCGPLVIVVLSLLSIMGLIAWPVGDCPFDQQGESSSLMRWHVWTWAMPQLTFGQTIPTSM